MSDSKYQEALDRLCENDYFDEKGNCNCELIVMDRILLQELVDREIPKKPGTDRKAGRAGAWGGAPGIQAVGGLF